MLRGRGWQRLLVWFLVLALARPVASLGATASLGTARGVRSAEMSLDGGKTWLPLGGRSLPIMPGNQIRSATGAVFIDLADGSRVDLLPFSALRFQQPAASVPAGNVPGRSGAGAESALDVFLQYGRLSFRFPEAPRTGIVTPSARLEPVRSQAAAGEVVVGSNGATGVKMTQGSIQVRELAGAQRTLVASREPVFVPERPPAPGLLFSSDIPASPPPGTKAVFGPGGENVGYLTADSRLVVQPGYAANLTRPFASGTVQQATARMPEASRAGALPLLDVSGAYVGYVAGPLFYAAAQEEQKKPPAGAPEFKESLGGGLKGIPWYYYAGGAALAVGAGVGIAVAAGGGGGEAPASPIAP